MRVVCRLFACHRLEGEAVMAMPPLAGHTTTGGRAMVPEWRRCRARRRLVGVGACVGHACQAEGGAAEDACRGPLSVRCRRARRRVIVVVISESFCGG